MAMEFDISDELSPDNLGRAAAVKDSPDDRFYDFFAESPVRAGPKKQALRVSDASTAAPDETSPARSSAPSPAPPSELFYLNRAGGSRSPPNAGLDEIIAADNTYKQRRNKRRKERRKNEKRTQQLSKNANKQLGVLPCAKQGVPPNHLPTETWGDSPSGHLLNEQGAPPGHSQIGKQSESTGHLPVSGMEMPNKPASAQYIDHLESLESLSHHSSVSEDRGSAEWDFDISKVVADEENASRDAALKAEDLRMAEIQQLVDEYFRCAKPEHCDDFNLQRKRELRSEL